MKFRTIQFLAIFVIHSSCISLFGLPPQQEIPLWPNGAPGALGNSTNDIPTLTPYLPETSKATGAAIIICPGGGYGGLSDPEGAGYAKWLSDHGVTAFVLKYRLGSHGYRHPVMLQDASRAMRMVRSSSQKWKIDPNKIGIMGSSAGGHLASTLLTHFDAGKTDDADPIERVSSRPDLGILCYSVITMGADTHAGSKSNLLGNNPTQQQIDLLSNEKQITKETPPCFIWHTWKDTYVKVENSLLFAMALREHGVPFDLHIYQEGEHGMALGKNCSDPSKLHPWTDDLLYWLHSKVYVK